MNHYDEIDYFSFRINISKSCTRAQVANLLSRHEHVLACFENADRDVKNDHCHIVIWNEKINEEAFVARMKLEIPGTKGNGRYAVCREHEKLEKELKCALQYICKGTIQTLPDVIISQGINNLEIEQHWRNYWSHNLVSTQKKKEDDSMRNIEVIWRKNVEKFESFKISLKDEPTSKWFCAWGLFWYDAVCEHYFDEFKVWEDAKITGIINGLLLRSDRVMFQNRKEQKIMSLLGLNNLEKNYILDL